MSFRAYRYYESGDRFPPAPILKKLSEITGKSINWILSNNDVCTDFTVVKLNQSAKSGDLYDDETIKILGLLEKMSKKQKIETLRFIEGQNLLAEREKKLK